MSVQVLLVRTVPHVMTKSMVTPVNVQRVMRVPTVRQTQMNVPVTPVRMAQPAMTTSMDTPACVHQDMPVSSYFYVLKCAICVSI